MNVDTATLEALTTAYRTHLEGLDTPALLRAYGQHYALWQNDYTDPIAQMALDLIEAEVTARTTK